RFQGDLQYPATLPATSADNAAPNDAAPVAVAASRAAAQKPLRQLSASPERRSAPTPFRPKAWSKTADERQRTRRAPIAAGCRPARVLLPSRVTNRPRRARG